MPGSWRGSTVARHQADKAEERGQPKARRKRARKCLHCPGGLTLGVMLDFWGRQYWRCGACQCLWITEGRLHSISETCPQAVREALAADLDRKDP